MFYQINYSLMVEESPLQSIRFSNLSVSVLDWGLFLYMYVDILCILAFTFPFQKTTGTVYKFYNNWSEWTFTRKWKKSLSNNPCNPDIPLLYWFFTLSLVFYSILWKINWISCQWYTLPSLFPEVGCQIRSHLSMRYVITIPWFYKMVWSGIIVLYWYQDIS